MQFTIVSLLNKKHITTRQVLDIYQNFACVRVWYLNISLFWFQLYSSQISDNEAQDTHAEMHATVSVHA